jgi:LysM repeat protein
MQTHIRMLLIVTAATWLGGCVMTEKYEAEKTRALNFQRLLAQEEKRTGELDAQVKQLRRDATEIDARSRELTAQLQAVREQLARTQEDLEVARQAAKPASARKDAKPKTKAKAASQPAPRDNDAELAAPPSIPDEPVLSLPPTNDAGGEPRYHAVKSGETLFRLARRYNVTVDKLRKWNGLNGNEIEVGQKLIVGYE